jgi:hypothetical protein
MSKTNLNDLRALLSPYANHDIEWLDDLTLRCGGVDLRLTQGFDLKPSTNQTLTLFKDAKFVASYLALLANLDVRNMIEVGVFDGGSAVFFWNLLKPRKLCCIELKKTAPYLKRYTDEQAISQQFAVHLGVNQADKSQLQLILAEDFASEPIDLVIDDASHLYAPSRATFEVLFPRLRNGAIYVLEDWKTNLLLPNYGGGEVPDHPPFHQLVYDILDLSMRFPEVIPAVKCFHNFVVIKRGPAALDSQVFDVLDHASVKGRAE